MRPAPGAGRLLVLRSLVLAFTAGCGNGSGGGPTTFGPDGSAKDVTTASLDAAPNSDTGVPGETGPTTDASDTGAADGPSPLAFTCFGTSDVPAEAACPAPSSKMGVASFCYRPMWAGATKVEVFGGFGMTTDWTDSFLTLTNDGTGTFTGTATLANGSYPYLYRVYGGDDDIIRATQYMLDPNNPHFTPSPPGSPTYVATSTVPRSVSQLVMPETSTPEVVLRGSVLFGGRPQSCFSIDLEAGEVTVGGVAKQEHDTANFTESASDGSFAFPLVAGAYQVVVRYPFPLGAGDGGYPDPSATPTMGFARIALTVATGETLDPIDAYYPDYSKMSPTTGSATLPVTFAFSLIPGAESAYVAVITTDIAGNDPAYASKAGTATTLIWDGGLGGTARVTAGKTYYWGTWQQKSPLVDGGPAWNEESLLFPLVLH